MYQPLLHHVLEGHSAELPGVGYLVPEIIAARKDVANALLHPPFLRINFQTTAPDSVTSTGMRSFADAAFHLQGVLGRSNEAYVPGIGNFFFQEGKLLFNQEPVAMEFAPPAPATRIVRTGEAHAMVVGDSDTTTEEMTAYYDDIDQTSTHDRWWVGALILLGIALVGIIVYYLAFRQGAASLGPLQF